MSTPTEATTTPASFFQRVRQTLVRWSQAAPVAVVDTAAGEDVSGPSVFQAADETLSALYDRITGRSLGYAQVDDKDDLETDLEKELELADLDADRDNSSVPIFSISTTPPPLIVNSPRPKSARLPRVMSDPPSNSSAAKASPSVDDDFEGKEEIWGPYHPDQEDSKTAKATRKSEVERLKENFTPKIVQPIRKSEREKKPSEAAKASAAYFALDVNKDDTSDKDDDEVPERDDEYGDVSFVDDDDDEDDVPH